MALLVWWAPGRAWGAPAAFGFDGTYNVDEEDWTAGGGFQSNLCPTPFTNDRTSKNRYGSVKVKTAGDKVTFTRDAQVILVATLGADGASFTGESPAGVTPTMKVTKGKFDADGTFTISQPLINADTPTQCFLVDVHGRGGGGGGSGGTAASTGKHKGSAITLQKVAGVGALIGISIGGYKVWQRRRAAPPPPPPKVAGGVPPKCAGLAAQFDDENEKLAALQFAATDLPSQLDRAERIHKNNVIKAKLVVGIEIASAFSGPALDLAIAMRRNYMRSMFRPSGGGSAFGELDTWKPPGSIGAKLAAALEKAEAAAQAALASVKRLTQQAEELAASLARSVEELPGVKEARENFVAARGRFGEIEHEFTECERLRTELSQLDAASQAGNQEMIAWRERIYAQQNKVAAAESKIAQAKGKLGVRDMLQRDIAKLQGDMEQVQDTMRLSELEYDLQSKQAQLARLEAEPDVKQALNDLPSLESGLANEQRDLDGITNLAQPELDRLGAQSEELSKQRREANLKLYQNEYRTAADVDEQRQIVASAGQRAEDVRAEAWNQRSAEVDAAKNAASEANAEYQRRLTELRDLREEASLPLRPPSEPSLGSRVLSGIGTAVKYPFTVLSEIVFGVGQSPEEIMEILRIGRMNVLLLHSHIEAVNAALGEQQELVDALRHSLDACISADRAQPVEAGAKQ